MSHPNYDPFEAEAGESLASPDIISQLFSKERLLHVIRKIGSRFDDSPYGFVRQPLKPILLLELGEDLANQISRQVKSGVYRPEGAYFCTIQKRSGADRELVFPSIADTIVARHIVDVLEPYIVSDDDGLTFSGRTNSSTAKGSGEYDVWTDKYRDYSLRIRKEAKRNEYSYIFHTDISDFYPSINRSSAKQTLAQRTAANHTLIELLFSVMEGWLPRFQYCQMSGLPVDDQDISRIVAHCYLKPLDKMFMSRSDVRYIRWVDDTTIGLPPGK